MSKHQFKPKKRINVNAKKLYVEVIKYNNIKLVQIYTNLKKIYK